MSNKKQWKSFAVSEVINSAAMAVFELLSDNHDFGMSIEDLEQCMPDWVDESEDWMQAIHEWLGKGLIARTEEDGVGVYRLNPANPRAVALKRAHDLFTLEMVKHDYEQHTGEEWPYELKVDVKKGGANE